MNPLIPIPIQILYAGLAGTLLAMVVAAVTNGWSLRVFLLLALRLAIGWHFLFEGMHKIHSHMMGPTESTRPFTSAPYFAVAQGPFGEYMRTKYLGDDKAAIAAFLTPVKPLSATEFAALSPSEQSTLVPTAAATDLAAITDGKSLERAKTAFARWVYGVDARDADVAFISTGAVAQTAPDRLKHLELKRKFLADLEARDALGLGNGFGIEQKRVAAARADVRATEASLAADAQSFLADLKTQAGVKAPEPQPKPIAQADIQTMWAITIIGACLLFGFATPFACLAGAGFLVLTYLTHPPFPWFPLPPNTEGNPLFINKNVIECLALLTIASFPTGRWMGLDALFALAWRLLNRKRTPETAAP
ncbi:MAG: hypothetical protein LC104_05950 [Bacteroidales bacterium]|nr:hypothetical protein [Bacteroidales bacterium]